MIQFVIYCHPSDYPDKFVVRRWVIGEKPVPDKEPHIVCDSLEKARESIPNSHRACIQRMTDDDPVIVEVWL